jgi:hypothetical protein
VIREMYQGEMARPGLSSSLMLLYTLKKKRKKKVRNLKQISTSSGEVSLLNNTVNTIEINHQSIKKRGFDLEKKRKLLIYKMETKVYI